MKSIAEIKLMNAIWLREYCAAVPHPNTDMIAKMDLEIEVMKENVEREKSEMFK